MEHRQLRKNILKIVIFLILPLVLIVNVLRGGRSLSFSVLELATETLEPVRYIDAHALEGFETFPMMRQLRGLNYELFVSSEPREPLLFFDDDFQWLETNEMLSLNTPQDTIYIIFENILNTAGEFRNFPTRDTFILKVFYNYEAISFRPLNQDTFGTEFLFSLSKGYQVHIPIQLSDVLEVNDHLNMLTVAIFGTPERHTIDREANFWNWSEMLDHYYLTDWGNGIVHHFVITYGGEQPPNLTGVYHEVNVFEDVGFFNALNIANEFDAFDQEAISTIPASPMRVRPNEEIELIFSGNFGYFPYFPEPTPPGYPELESYLIIALLDWQQVAINSLPYLLVDVSDGIATSETHQGRFSITAPAESGFYDFIAFVIANPSTPTTDEFNRNTHNRISFRFTIEVR